MSAESTTHRLASALGRLGLAVESVEELTGDVSPRRYFRVGLADREGCIVATYPPSLRDAQSRFVTTTGLLQTAGVKVPRILANSAHEGVMAVEDFGGRTLFAEGSYPGDDALYEAAEIALRIAAIDLATIETRERDALLPPLDGEVLQSEIDQTWSVALEPNGFERHSLLGSRLDECLTEACRHLGRADQRPCHRDFMARNLMQMPSGGLGVLDHQDLRLGPIGYDLASLVSDSILCPTKTVAVVRGAAQIDREHFDRLIAQRTFKIVGTFFAFAARGATRHLRLVPAALDAGRTALLRLPESSRLSGRERELDEALDRLSAAATPS